MNQSAVKSKTLYSEAELLNLLKLSNLAFVFNTSVRNAGPILNEITQRRLFSDLKISDMSRWFDLMEILKGVAHTLGIYTGYLRIAQNRDTSFVVLDWLYYSSISYLVLLLFNVNFDLPVMESILVNRFTRAVTGWLTPRFIFLLSDFVYHYQKGIRDAVRPELYGRIARLLHSSAVKFSDEQKRLFEDRKVKTTIAEMFSSIFMFALHSFFGLRNFILISSLLGFFTNLITYYYVLNGLNGFKLRDPMLTEADHDNFAGEANNWLLRVPVNSLKCLREMSVIPFNRDSVRDIKFNSFTYGYANFKLAGGLSKSTFFVYSSFYPDFDRQNTLTTRTVTNVLIFLFDNFKVYYRKRFGRHLIGSLNSIFLSGFLLIAANLTFVISDWTNSSIPLIFLGYPLFAFYNSIIIQGLNHLFQVWGIEDQKVSDSHLLRSFKNNMVSISLSNVSKTWLTLLRRLGLFLPGEVTMILAGFYFLNVARSYTTEAERV